MEKPLHLLDDNFRSQLAAKCDLFLYVGADFIQYAIIDHVQDQLKCVYESETGIRPAEFLTDLTHIHQYLKYNFRKVKVCFETFRFTFIPSEIYQESEVYQYAKFIGATSTHEILLNSLTRKIKCVTLADPELKEIISANFPDAEIYGQEIPAVLAAFQQFNGIEEHGLYIILRNNKLEISLIGNSELIIYNIFECFNADEFNFYLLNVVNQFSITKENTSVILAGSIYMNDEFYSRVTKYFERISFADINKLVTRPALFENIGGQEFFPLLSQNLCA